MCSPGYPGTHFVDQAGLELRKSPASASQVLGLKACATTACWKNSSQGMNKGGKGNLAVSAGRDKGPQVETSGVCIVWSIPQLSQDLFPPADHRERLFFVLLRTFALSALRAEVRISNGFPHFLPFLILKVERSGQKYWARGPDRKMCSRLLS